MSPFDLLYEPPWQRGTLTLFHFVWQGSAVAIGLLAVLWLFRVCQARARYALSLLAMLGMAACALVTLAVLGRLGDRNVGGGLIHEGEGCSPPPRVSAVNGYWCWESSS